MKKTIFDTLDTINKVARTTSEVSNAISSTANAINTISGTINNVKKNGETSIVSQVVETIQSIVPQPDVDYLAFQSKPKINNIIAGMTSLIADNNTKVKSIESQVWYQRMIKTVLGSNKATLNEIRQNHDNLNAYMADAISALYQRNAIDQRIIMSLGNQINELYRENNKMKQMIGAFAAKLNEKIESIDNFHLLNAEIQQGMYSELSSIEAVLLIVSQLDKRTLNDPRKLMIIQRSMVDAGIVNDQKQSLVEILGDIQFIEEENSGIIYMDQLATKGNYVSDIVTSAFSTSGLMLVDGGEEVQYGDLIYELIEEQSIDKNTLISTKDLLQDLIEGKINVMEGKAPISSIQYGPLLQFAENAFIEYRMEEAYNTFKSLAQHSISRATYFLGKFYNYSYGGFSVSEEEYNQHVKLGSYANEILGSIFYGFTIQDEKGKMEYFESKFSELEEAAEEGDVFAQHELALISEILYGEETLEEQIYWLIEASKNGNFESMRELGELFVNRMGAKEDQDRAVELFSQGAQIGDPICQLRLGYIYLEGELLEKDEAKALYWFRLSAEQENPDGQVMLAECHRLGFGVTPNSSEAFTWYLKAAENGNSYAQIRVAYSYEKGNGTKMSYAEACKWYEKAADQNEIDALLWLGDNHSTGLFKDNKKALVHYKKAAELENTYAMYKVGEMYMLGKGAKLDCFEAAKWFTKGSDLNDDYCQSWLAECYYSGNGVQKNMEMSKKYYMMSAEQGNEFAMKMLKKRFGATVK
ncbi:TPR repeat [Proteiniclasticum ruminis]|uniref:TPR repeat n=2 Tax=Proteiniclasticum ruminis TaxID=398199 RepID=A0A1G8LTH8_9CLOT|nr:TPR repeat [Proteiniclasticum ruminis]